MNPQTAMLNPAALIASQQRRSQFVPAVGGFVVAQLPGETLRCAVEKVFDDDTALVRIDKAPVSRMHTFRFNEAYAVRRRVSRTGVETWEMQTDDEFGREQTRIREAARQAAPRQAPRPAPSAPVAAVAPEPKKAAPKKAAPKKAAAKPKAKVKSKAKTPAKRKSAK